MSSVDHPSHYNAAKTILEDGTAKYEAIKVIRNWALGFGLGSAVKYILRSPHKHADDTEDIEKALWYVNEAEAHEWLFTMHSGREYFDPAVVAEDWGLSGPKARALQHIFDRNFLPLRGCLTEHIGRLL